MNKILIPTDFSANAMKAVLYAAEIAIKNAASLFLLHVITLDEIVERKPGSLPENYLDDPASPEMKELESIGSIIRNGYPDVKTEIKLSEGSVSNAILRFSNERKIDLIVMGTKGASGLKQVSIGSITAGTIAHTFLPVLAIPSEYAMEEPDNILFATNHFEENKELIDKIVDLAKLFHAVIHVAVFTEKSKTDAVGYIHTASQLEHYINFLKKSFPDVSFKGQLLDGKSFERTIEEYNEKKEVDIIALITYPKNAWEKMLKKSITRKMTFHSSIPVLAIPAGNMSPGK